MTYIECLIIDKNDYDEAIADDMSVVFASDIKKIPAVDATPVVRCKDCAVPHNKWTGCPNLNGLVPPPEHFCSYGERKDNATD